MPKGSNQKLKLYYLSRIMLEHTDEEHSLSLAEITSMLEEYGVTADRKTLYVDLQELSVLGITVMGEKEGNSYRYRVIGKQFELAELKLLVDAVQASKFITEKKSDELIKKLTKSSSVYEVKKLRRQVTVRGRIKSMNESIYYIVDQIHTAINENHPIRFDYYRWNTNKKLEKTEKTFYEVSPWALIWDDENYYMIAFDHDSKAERHYRVDKMKNLRMLSVKRLGMEQFEGYDLASFAKMSFGMYGGKKEKATIAFKNEMVGVFLDRFGKDIPILSAKLDGWSETIVDVILSPQFFGWIYALGSNVRITGSKTVLEEWKKQWNQIEEMYQ